MPLQKNIYPEDVACARLCSMQLIAIVVNSVSLVSLAIIHPIQVAGMLASETGCCGGGLVLHDVVEDTQPDDLEREFDVMCA